MPSRPPPLKTKAARKAWATSKPSPRLRGRAGVADRLRIRTEEPLCRACKAIGKVSASTRVDHIVPLSEGGGDYRSNKQGLCSPCHDAKSKAERAARAAGARRSAD